MVDNQDPGKCDDKKEGGTKSLNEQNWPGLLAITAFNLVVFGVVTATEPKWFADMAAAWAFLLPAGVGLAMIRVVNGLINSKNKDRLVFCRWTYPLPGFRAFSVHAKKDQRFDQASVNKKLRELGVNPATLERPAAQNKYWYNSVFYPVQDKPAVQQSERNFLFARDYTAISFVMLIALGAAGYFVIAPTKWLFYCGGLLLQYLFVSWAARNYGIETVKNALAAWVTAPVPHSVHPATPHSPIFFFVFEVEEDDR